MTPSDLHVGLLAADLTHKYGWAHYSLSLIQALRRALAPTLTEPDHG